MTILVVNNNGGGFAERMDVPDGCTISGLMDCYLEDVSASNSVIRVNRSPVEEGYVLQPGDKVTVTPTKIDGAW